MLTYTGIGTLQTSHGSPDARLRASQDHQDPERTVDILSSEGARVASPTGSEGDSTHIEE